MKNVICIVTLILVCTMALPPAFAVEIKATGTFWNVAQFLDHDSFQADNGTNNFTVRQRFRSQIEVIANEMLSGIAYFEINHTWGQDSNGNKFGRSSGGDLGTDGVGVQTKRLYLHLNIPYTELAIYAGLQGLTYPGAVAGSVIFDDDIAGVVATYGHSEKLSGVLAWLRPFDIDTTDNQPVTSHNHMDMFLLSLYFQPKHISFNPYFSYATLGENVKFGSPNYTYDIGPSLGLDNSFINVERTENADVFWAGLAVTADFSNFKLFLDGIYGKLTANKAAERSGWFTAAKLTYSFDNITPGITAWWASGDDSNAYEDGAGRMPFVNAGWLISSYGFDNTHANETGNRIADATGKVGAGIVLEDITFVDWMTQQLQVIAMWGTNDSSIVKNGFLEDPTSNIAKYLTDKDFLLEVNYEANIELYEQLTIIPSVAYIHVDLDESTWGISNVRDSWRVALITKYTY
ncbi:outer membrane homotrimeric porin [Halodesulfovibrio marinisediminis]|uniref:Porin n=1 Tax=Halodesulfovibrio marinisediminis DSM 17456 TaxID=1121457 RepID=A0A1N6GQ97_9BACT|nr:outer membrane homotrimeric porin [Halodesulfovibrio marinisediminis]SIO09683.1 hypothetical protein SAMN02745161_1735 [Halodesulfovibrio marinisediminis DSM 17456]